ncbi:glycoside hydrolase family 15 protein [Noviherbaspirillum sp.]|uniref:glycoside hydrolase family 15 protein n=1 Tax=Noviherbaspirillum sp. TaxID=1926288 RepID=UPI002D244522|nr:glycoside hydrolase family 15 protein [Noviherbaspirillum sp.]HZW21565.1 glycoside hydrolase family 15 protein [Noviherbaspirillum sp.]
MQRYPPIADYALISDCHCAALVSRDGSIDWCCMPRIDDDSCFGRLLDWDRGGYCAIAPTSEECTSTRTYVDGSMILETHFRTPDGEVRLYDFFAMDTQAIEHARYDHVRIVDGLSGSVEMRMEVRPRFDYGDVIPHIRCDDRGAFAAIGSNKGLIIHADVPLDVERPGDLASVFRVDAGQRVRLVIQFQFPELIDRTISAGLPDAAGIDRFFDCTRDWWQAWAQRIHASHAVDGQSLCSAIVLKALSSDRTGAIAAAATTSLPEWIGGERNWDYRFSWIRDSVFTVRALHELGYVEEANRFHQFIQRSAAGDAEQMQIMYGVDGKRRLTEIELDWLEGYRGSKPVRIGNGAARQVQLDVYGELLEMAWEWHAHGHRTEPEYWDFLVDVVDLVCHRWEEPDHGFWEVRGAPRHHVHSKAMCWAALNRGVMLAQDNRFPAPIERWCMNRDMIRDAIEREGYDDKRGIFVQAFGSDDLDAALLLMPRVGLLAYDDPRMLRTTDAICETLDYRGLLRRYRSPDGLAGEEGVFLPCTFWLVNCLARQGRKDKAWAYYHRALACANDLGLFSEEYDVEGKQMLGNFPQGLTHVSQIMARLALGDVPETEGEVRR